MTNKEKFSHISDWMRWDDNAYLKHLQKEMRKQSRKNTFQIYQVLAVREWEAELEQEKKGI